VKLFAGAWREAVEAPSPTVAEAAIATYLRAAPPMDAAWALWFLSGKRCGKTVPAAQLRQWALTESGLPDWLFDECHRNVGNLAETVAHLVAGTVPRPWPLHRLVDERLVPLAAGAPAQRRELVMSTWRELALDELDLWNRLLAGALRPRPSAAVVASALASVVGGDPAGIEERLQGDWVPSPRTMADLALVGSAGEARAPLLFTATGEQPPTGWASDARNAHDVRGGHTFDAVLLYAQRSEGGRGAVYSELTLGVWEQGALVPVARTAGGLSPDETLELDRWVRRNVVDRFGPVRHVRPELVFEVACEAVVTSRRHKAGVTVRGPRLVRWRRESRAEDAATLATLRELVEAEGAAPPEARGGNDPPPL
jgi:hypothetical protein